MYICITESLCSNFANQLHFDKMNRKLVAHYLVLFIVFMKNVMKNQP